MLGTKIPTPPTQFVRMGAYCLCGGPAACVIAMLRSGSADPLVLFLLLESGELRSRSKSTYTC